MFIQDSGHRQKTFNTSKINIMYFVCEPAALPYKAPTVTDSSQLLNKCWASDQNSE